MSNHPLTQIVDAHHHLWNPVSSEPDVGYVWLRDIGAPKPFGDPTPIQRDYLLDEFLSEPSKATFKASVHLQADGAIPDPVAETAFIQQLSDAADYPIAIVGFVDLSQEDAPEVIERHLRFRNFRGVRQILSRLEGRPEISFAGQDYVNHPRWREQFCLLRDHRLSFDAQLYPEQMLGFAEFLERFSDVQVIIDHAGSPYDRSPQGLSLWKTGLTALSALQNVSIKLCGFGMFDPAWNGTTIRPLLDEIERLFGEDRMLFASNFPVDKLMRDYDSLLGDLDRHFQDRSAAARHKIFCGNALRIYRL